MTPLKPFFGQATVDNSQPRELLHCGSIRFTAVTGSVTTQFGDGKPITVSEGDKFEAPWPLVFDKVTIVAGAAGTATFVHGVGIQAGGNNSSTGIGGTIQPTSGDPEGVLNAADGQWAYDPTSGAVYLNPNTSGTSGWVTIIA
jgi:hypothetical protein